MQQTIEPPRAEAPWSSASDPLASANPLHRFLGGAPAAVFVRLFFVSLLVGALLMWLDIRPFDIFEGVRHLFQRLWGLGFDAVREVAEYVVAGAVVVVPIWLVTRLLSQRPR